MLFCNQYTIIIQYTIQYYHKGMNYSVVGKKYLHIGKNDKGKKVIHEVDTLSYKFL